MYNGEGGEKKETPKRKSFGSRDMNICPKAERGFYG
jgi:hypothetical protein